MAADTGCGITRAFILLLGVTTIAGPASAQAPLARVGDFSPRPSIPRIAPVPEQARTEAQRQMLAGRPDFNIFKTLAHHPELYNRWSGLGGFLLNGSSLPARQREMLMLRMGWLCQSEYEWAQHARIATSTAGVTDEEIHRVAEGPRAAGWTDFERGLLRMVDELRYDALISDGTWRELRTEYSDQQMMEALFTAAQYQLVSMVLNSLGVQLDPGLRHRLPRDLPFPKLAGPAKGMRLSTPRITPLRPDQCTPQQRELLAPQIEADGSLLNLYATMIQHPRLYAPRQSFGSYLRSATSLPPKTRELLIMRTAFLIGSEYQWAHHVEYARGAGFTDEEIARIGSRSDTGWSEEHRALLRAADELRREAFITNRTWTALAKHYNTKQLVEIVYTVGGYTMTGLAINSFGVQVEPGYSKAERNQHTEGRVRSADGVEIVYSAHGMGDTALVFIHGGLADRSFWKPQLALLADRFRVVALDLAGHGESGRGRKAWTISAFGEDVRAVVEALGLKRVVLIGNSLGGPVALDAARLLPGRVLAVVGVDTLHDATIKFTPADAHARAEAFRKDFSGTCNSMVDSLFHPGTQPELRAWSKRRMCAMPAEVVVGLMEGMGGYDLAGAFRAAGVPIRAINGDLFPTNVERNRTVTRDFDAAIITGAGHYPMLERPDEFNRLLVDIVSKLNGPGMKPARK